MNVFPVSFPLEGKSVLVVGGGEEARRKVRLLAKTPADIVVVSETVSEEFRGEFSSRVRWLAGISDALEQTDFALAVIAVDDERFRTSIHARIKSYGIPVNAVDAPELCDWHTPAIVERGPVVIGVSTGGVAPVVGRHVRRVIEEVIPRETGAIANSFGRLRDKLRFILAPGETLRHAYERAMGSKAVLDAAGDGDAGLDEAVLAAVTNHAHQGSVELVGAGPGDPDLLTIKALRSLQSADIVYYDALVSDEILDLIRRDADRVFVGKRKANHAVPQHDIAELMIGSAKAGLRVVRLKGGDPFIFGRGGEEVEAVEAAGIRVSVIPGISSALGCAARTNIPLTHRDHAQSVTFVTGHAAKGAPDLDWATLARRNQTVVVFMGVGTAAETTRNLLDHGRAGSTPVAVIENGTRPDEKVARGELGNLPNLIRDAGIAGPAILIIGEVAGESVKTQRIQEMVAA